ncbi:MAG: phosphotransferase [Bacillota bacterium]
MRGKDRQARGGFKGGFRDFLVAARVAEGFGFRLRGCRRSGKGILIETEEGPKEIFPLPYPAEEYRFIAEAAEFLRRRGFSRLPKIVLTPEGNLTVSVAGEDYAVRDWVPGRPFNLEDPCRLAQAVELLAGFHRAAEGFRPANPPENRKEWSPWSQRFLTRLEDFYRWEGRARETAGRDRFARLFSACFDEILAAATRSLEELALLPCKEIVEVGRERGGLCHGDYHEENLILAEDGGLFLTDFEHLALGTKLDDLGDFLFRYGGLDPDRLLFILQVYRAAAPLTREEVACLLAYLRFPHGCWEAIKAFCRGESSGEKALRRAVEEISRRAEVLAALRQADLSFLESLPVFPAAPLSSPDPFVSLPEPSPEEKTREELPKAPVLPASGPEPISEVQALLGPEKKVPSEIPSAPLVWRPFPPPLGRKRKEG